MAALIPSIYCFPHNFDERRKVDARIAFSFSVSSENESGGSGRIPVSPVQFSSVQLMRCGRAFSPARLANDLYDRGNQVTTVTWLLRG